MVISVAVSDFPAVLAVFGRFFFYIYYLGKNIRNVGKIPVGANDNELHLVIRGLGRKKKFLSLFLFLIEVRHVQIPPHSVRQ